MLHRFVIELQSRPVQVLGSTPYPDEAFVIQCLREVNAEPDALLRAGRILVCDRDPKWSRAVEQWLSTTAVRVIRYCRCAPNNAHAERFVRSVNEECRAIANNIALYGDGGKVAGKLVSASASTTTGGSTVLGDLQLVELRLLRTAEGELDGSLVPTPSAVVGRIQPIDPVVVVRHQVTLADNDAWRFRGDRDVAALAATDPVP